MHDEQTIALAVILNRFPSEIAGMSYMESLAFYEAQQESQHSRMKFDAALHGAKIS